MSAWLPTPTTSAVFRICILPSSWWDYRYTSLLSEVFLWFVSYVFKDSRPKLVFSAIKWCSMMDMEVLDEASGHFSILRSSFGVTALVKFRQSKYRGPSSALTHYGTKTRHQSSRSRDRGHQSGIRTNTAFKLPLLRHPNALAFCPAFVQTDFLFFKRDLSILTEYFKQRHIFRMGF